MTDAVGVPDCRVALVGDFKAEVTAHQAIPLALAHKVEGVGRVEWTWLPTAAIPDDPSRLLAPFDGLWCVPASPYENTPGAIAAIRHARTTRLPFLGTCGGFQHALLEYAESVWGIASPEHAELDPSASNPVIAPLACALVEASAEVLFIPGSTLARLCGSASRVETYHCRYGLSARFEPRLATGPLRVSARDRAGEIRAVELDNHPFFVATLFQPERAALAGRPHPIITAFVSAAAAAGREG